jgi:hypothetical protein
MNPFEDDGFEGLEPDFAKPKPKEKPKEKPGYVLKPKRPITLED